MNKKKIKLFKKEQTIKKHQKTPQTINNNMNNRNTIQIHVNLILAF